MIYLRNQDENKDGVFTVDELKKWINENKLAQFFAEGRDADIARIIDSVADEVKQDDNMSGSSDKGEIPQKQSQG